MKTRGKVLSGEYRSPRKRNSRRSSTNHCPQAVYSYYLFIIAKLFKVKDGCLKFVYIGKNPQFTAFLDSKIHTRLAIVTANELGLAFPSRNLPEKISSRSVHVSFSYRGNRQTNKQTDRQTYAGDSIIPRESFRGDKYRYSLALEMASPVNRHCASCIGALSFAMPVTD